MADVPLDDREAEGALADHLGEAKILDRGEQPGDKDRPRNLALELPPGASLCDPAPVLSLLVEPASEHLHLERRCGHPLPVDRVERAERIAEDEVAVREARDPLVVASQPRGDMVRVDGGGWLRLLEKLAKLRHREGLREADEAVRVRRWVVATPAPELHQQRLVVGGEHDPHPPSPWRLGEDGERQPTDIKASRKAIDPRRVANAHLDLSLRHPREAGVDEPPRRTGAATATIDDQVCLDLLRLRGALVLTPDPRHPVGRAIDEQACDVAIIEHFDVGPGAHTAPDRRLEDHPVGQVEGDADAIAGLPHPVVKPANVARRVDRDRPRRAHVRGDVWEELGDDRRPRCQEDMGVAGLRSALPADRPIVEIVALDDQDPLEVLR